MHFSYPHACYISHHLILFDLTTNYVSLPYTDSWDSAVGIVTRYGAGQPRGQSSSLGGGKNFHFYMSSELALGPTQPPMQWVAGVLPPGVKWLRREADHSPPTSAEVKKTWVYISTPPYIFMA
jgi:hypothetical protein